MAYYCITRNVQSSVFHSSDVIRRNAITYYKNRIIPYTILVFCQSKFARKAFLQAQKFLHHVDVIYFYLRFLYKFPFPNIEEVILVFW